jgi:hypothetical protein
VARFSPGGGVNAPCYKASAFFEARRDWLQVRIMHAFDGRYDVLLRIDGTYEHDLDPEYLAQVRDHFVKEIVAVLDDLDAHV